MSDSLFDFEEPVRKAPEKTHACTGMSCQVCHGSAKKAADTAVRRGAKAADPEWWAAATGILWDMCSGGADFTTDEVMEALEELGVATHDSRALGGVVRRFLNKGLMVEVGTTKSRRRHGARIPIYAGARSRQMGGTAKKEHDVRHDGSRGRVGLDALPPRHPLADVYDGGDALDDDGGIW